MSLSKLPRRIYKSYSHYFTQVSKLNDSLSYDVHGQFGRFLSTSISRAAGKALPPRPKLDDDDITGSYLKGSGPGGQKINKTNSAVQLIHKPTGIVVKSQATRSRSQNQKIAREILAEKVEMLEKGELSRTAIKNALKKKRKASKAKKSRRKYRALEEKVKRKDGGNGARGVEEIQGGIATNKLGAINEKDENKEKFDGRESEEYDIDPHNKVNQLQPP